MKAKTLNELVLTSLALLVVAAFCFFGNVALYYRHNFPAGDVGPRWIHQQLFWIGDPVTVMLGFALTAIGVACILYLLGLLIFSIGISSESPREENQTT